jgi:dynein heavy chain, axonemal
LDVKQTRWHDDFGQTFKDEVKGIETFYTTIITLTFKHVSTCNDSVEMLENFQQLAKRESIKDFVHTKAANTVYQKIIEEIREIEQQFDVGMSGKRRPPMSMSNPTFGGLAVWALSLI